MKAVAVCMNQEIKIVDVPKAEADWWAVNAFSDYLLSNYQCSFVREKRVPLPNQYGISCISDETGTFDMNPIATEFCSREIRGDCIIACIHHRARELFPSHAEDVPQSVINMLMEIAASR